MPNDLRNKITVDFKNNAELAAAFQGKQPGDEFTLEIKGNVISLTDQGFEGSVTTLAVPGYTPPGPEKEPGDEMEPNAEMEPVLIAVTGSKSRTPKPTPALPVMK